MFDTTTPLASRNRFGTRKFLNFVILAVGCIAGVTVLSWLASILFSSALLPMLVGDAIALGTTYFLYLSWEKHPLKLKCPDCDKTILSNTPWVCGACGKPNKNTAEFPFINRCGHSDCAVEPKSYKCHHCGQLIFLTEDEDKTTYARALNSAAEEPKSDELTEKVKQYQFAKLSKQQELELVELDQKLNEIKMRIEGPKLKDPYEEKQKLFERDYAGIMGLKDIARKKRQEVRLELKDHPEELQQALEAIDEVEMRHS